MSKLLQDGASRHTEFIQERNQYDDIIAEKKGRGRLKSTAQEKKETKKLLERTHPKTIYTQFFNRDAKFWLQCL